MAGSWLLGARAESPRAVLVAVRPEPDVAAGELRRLAEIDGVRVVDVLVQTRQRPDPATYLGAGRTADLADAVRRARADVVIVDGELTPGQARNLRALVGVPVVDRTALILDIFAEHARTGEGRLPTELAYRLPRLREAEPACGRVIAGVRGSAEKRREIGRRRLRRRAAGLRESAAELGRRRERTHLRRSGERVPSVVVTGYVNAGKSALLNCLTAGTEPTVRPACTLTDTVGFVRNLPHQLIPAFRSTLNEVARADLAVHVVDAAAPEALSQITIVHGVWHEIGAGAVPELLVLNKIDVAPPEWVAALRRVHPGALAVSASTGAGIPELRDAMAARLRRPASSARNIG